MPHPIRFLAILLVFGYGAIPSVQANDLRVPPGFEVIEFAGSDLANDIHCMTLDPNGRVIVSGAGYIKILVDDNGDGRADRAIPFADSPKSGAMGMLWEGDALYVTGDGGLWRYRDQDGDDRADGPSEFLWPLPNSGEHGAHAIRRGPDGWLYVLGGDATGFDSTYANAPTSPIDDPTGGCVVRFDPDFQTVEIVAHGYRNPYDMDFNLDGELFTFDSDNERCVSLPWYEYTRFYHVIPGGHHGWLARQRTETWRYPPSFDDVVPPVATLGRGSPTGVACYRHSAFPEHYQGGFFLLDWTFGVVHFVRLERSGASYHAETEVFARSIGSSGFAPTAVVVHPESGDLYLSIGGRGTRGAVYRIRYGGEGRPDAETKPIPLDMAPPLPLDWQDDLKAAIPHLAASTNDLDRLRALIALRRHRPRFEAPQIRAAILSNWEHSDRLIRQAAAALIATFDTSDRRSLAERARTPWPWLTLGFGIVADHPNQALDLARAVLDANEATPEQTLAAVRLVQCALGDLAGPDGKGTVWEGYAPRNPEQARSAQPEAIQAIESLHALFPTGHAEVDREIARTLALRGDEDPHMLKSILEVLSNQSDPVDTIHYLVVLAQLRSPPTSEATELIAETLVALDCRLDAIQANRDRNWPLRMRELVEKLIQKDSNLSLSILNHSEFGRPDHALFAQATGFDRSRAAVRLLETAEADLDFEWNAAVVELVGALPPERSFPVLRGLWRSAGLDEVILPILARSPKAVDRSKFLDGLISPRPATVRVCLDALERLEPPANGSEFLPFVLALRQLPEGDATDPLRSRISQFLRQAANHSKAGSDPDAWVNWFSTAYPELAGRLTGADSIDVEAWRTRLDHLDWTVGDAERGREVFVRASCASCHSGNQAMGPDLSGVTGRFSREDLFTAILQPNLDVPDRYRATLLATDDGNVYQGIIIYEAVDGAILQTGPAETIRIAGPRIIERRLTTNSLMPTGLLDDLTDEEISDLFAYLRGLSAP